MWPIPRHRTGTARLGLSPALLVLVALAGACGDDGGPAPTAASSSMPSATSPPTVTPVPPTTTPTPVPTATPRGPAPSPFGFPIDPATRLGVVVGTPGSRELRFDGGPSALDYSRDQQSSDDPVAANASGWDCRVHVEYEGLPAVDWYVPPGTPIHATMDGTATLLVNTISNPFDVYGVSREPYIGNPDRAHAPVSPFPGPGGGQGAFVRIENGAFRTDYAHLDLARSMTASVPAGAWLAGYAPGDALLAQFAPLRDFRVATAVARWGVHAGDVIGYSGDSGYSEGPHLHYTVQDISSGSAAYRCPTMEPGFADAGWLFRD